MKFNLFGDFGSKLKKPAKETFTRGQDPKSTSASSSIPKPTPTGPKLLKCPENGYIPHHRNLSLKPGASNEDIKAAWRRTSLRLHPDKIRDPAQKEVAAAAMVLINEAYERLYKEDGWWRWIGNDDKVIDSSERLRRREERSEEGGCRDLVRRKPWFWPYKEQSLCSRDGDLLCGEFWATLMHNVVDNVLPFQMSDALWASIDKTWRYELPARPDFEKLTFYGPCYQTYTVTLPALRVAQIAPPRWSSFKDTKCNTTLSGELPDVLVLLIVLGMVVVCSQKVWFSLLFYNVKVVIICFILCRMAISRLVRKAFWFCTWPVRKLFHAIHFIWRSMVRKLSEGLETDYVYD